MANMRVHELAKELNISSKEIIETLSNDTKKYTASNGLTDSEITSIRSKFGKKAAQPEKPKTEAKQEDKKSHISQVYFPQNSTKAPGNDTRKGNQNQTKNDNQMNNRNNNQNNNRKSDTPRNENGRNNYAGNRDNNRNDRDRNDRSGNGDRHNGYRNDRNGNNGYRNDRNDRNGNGGGNNGYRNDRNDRNGNGDRNNGYRNDRNDRNGNGGGNNGYRNDRNGNGGGNNGYRNDRNGNGGGNNGYRNDRNDRNGNGGGNNGYRNDRNGNGGGNNGYRNDRNGQGGNSGRRNDRDRKESLPKNDFLFETKPDARKPESRRDNKKNDRRKDEEKENLKFANSQANKKVNKPVEKEEETIKQLVLPDSLTIKELADKMKVQPSVVVKKLFMQGKIVTINQEVDYDTAEEIALEFNCICEHEEKVDVIAELLKEDDEAEDTQVTRPPVVCVMGHVDHGKTSLLDAIRETHVTAKESGGITQKIGAYTVSINDHLITFLDTPGHEAFTAMRMRGAQATDIAILVVAADDGVMPQTIEAINHAKAAGIEIVVAINKIDKPSANIDRVKQELTEYELIPEDWGGSTICVPVSAHTGEGIKELLEMVLLTAEVMELKANPNRRARGLVIEAELDKGKGPVATVLVQKGTLRVGDPIAAGSAYGKVRAMMDDQGRRVKEAGPSMPVEILGLNDVPNAGEVFVGCKNDKDARSFAETFISQNKIKKLEETKSKMSLDDLFNQIQEGNLKELGIVVKADVQGSVEAIKQSLVKLSNEEVVVKIIHGGVGAINESDVTLAAASNAIIIGFNVRPDATAKETAEREGVDVRLYRVIYNAIEDVESAMKGMLEPVFEEKVLGHAEVRQTFKASGVGTIAGSYVLDGTFERDCQARIVRDGVVIYDGKLASLKRFKDDVKEVKAGYECGFVFERFNDVKEGDQVEAFKMVEVPR